MGEGGLSYLRDTYHFKDTVGNIDLQEGDRMGTLDVVGMFPNVPVKKALEITRAKLEQDETLAARTKWSVDDIMSLLEISIEMYLRRLMGRFIYRETVYQLENQSRSL